jgi:alpha-glucosidase
MQLSAFFPFYRNHNDVASIDQEPYLWPSVIEASTSAMAIRYTLLPYIYTLFYLAHTTGSTVMRALSWEFPDDPSLVDADRQFFLGPSLMVIPVLVAGATTVDGVFPGQDTVWYDWYTHSAVEVKPGVNTTLAAPLGHIPVYVRGGSILPMQEPALTTRDARKTPWSLLIALDHDGGASGQLYVDDGESVAPNTTLVVEFVVKKGESSLTASVQGDFEDKNQLDQVIVLGVPSVPSSDVTFNGDTVPSRSVSYNETLRVLSATGLKQITGGGAWSKSWELRW